MSNPYDHLPESAFWRTAVAQKHFSEIGPLWSPRFNILPVERVVTYGSCFAQHIGNALQKHGFSWYGTEPPPPALSAAEVKRFNYNIFSCRTANIYTPTLLLQWARWALLNDPSPLEVWEKDGRYYDPFRPAIEPDGFASREELLALRDVTIKAFAKSIRTANCFVFTLGLTESWRNREHGYEYPMCPGTVAGTFDAGQHEFDNLGIFETIDAMRKALDIIHEANKNLRIILTVSPVPLTATNSGGHVMVATMESKSILRATAAQMCRHRPYVDYFPSYEIINSPVMQGVFFEPNRRQVAPMGVDFVMEHFFACLQGKFGQPEPVEAKQAPVDVPRSIEKSRDDIVCEEELLAAFGPKT